MYRWFYPCFTAYLLPIGLIYPLTIQLLLTGVRPNCSRIDFTSNSCSILGVWFLLHVVMVLTSIFVCKIWDYWLPQYALIRIFSPTGSWNSRGLNLTWVLKVEKWYLNWWNIIEQHFLATYRVVFTTPSKHSSWRGKIEIWFSILYVLPPKEVSSAKKTTSKPESLISLLITLTEQWLNLF